MERNIAGEIADAEPLATETYNQPEDKTTIGRVTRYTTAYITDPVQYSYTRTCYQFNNPIGR